MRSQRLNDGHTIALKRRRQTPCHFRMGCGVVLHPTYLEADGLEELAKLDFRSQPDLLPFGEAPSLRTRQRPTFFEGQPESAAGTQELAHHAHEPPLVLEGEHRLVQEDGLEGGGIYRGQRASATMKVAPQSNP